MEWQEYISRILADSASFDGISLSFGEAEEFAVPPIIKASVLMLDKMLEHQGQFNILVFPTVRNRSLPIIVPSSSLHSSHLYTTFGNKFVSCIIEPSTISQALLIFSTPAKFYGFS